jgi:hypothetical protein
MEEQEQYHDELLEWCNNIYLYWNSMKPNITKHSDVESFEAWEGSCRQLTEKLQSNLNVEFNDYETAKGLYEQLEQLIRETDAYQEELEVDFDERLIRETDAYQEELEIDFDERLEEQTQFDEELLESAADQEEMEVDSDVRVELEKLKQIHKELLESGAYQEENEVELDNRLELAEQMQVDGELLEAGLDERIEEQTLLDEELLESGAYQEEMEVDSDERIEEQIQVDEELLETDAIDEEIEIEADNYMDLAEQEQRQYREELLEWCNNIYSNWEIMKPRFSKLIDIKSLEEWEGSYREFTEKLQGDLRADFDDYQTAISLYQQWEQLFRESYSYRAELGDRNISFIIDNRIFF